MPRTIFVAIKERDTVDPRMHWAHPHHYAASNNWLLVSTSPDQHAVNITRAAIGRGTTSIDTPGYEPGFSYASFDVTPTRVQSLLSQDGVVLIFAKNVDEMSAGLTEAAEAERTGAPLRNQIKYMPEFKVDSAPQAK